MKKILNFYPTDQNKGYLLLIFLFSYLVSTEFVKKENRSTLSWWGERICSVWKKKDFKKGGIVRNMSQ